MTDDTTKDIVGFDETDPGRLQDKPWEPVSDRMLRVGIAGHGICQFGAAFGVDLNRKADITLLGDQASDHAQCDDVIPPVRISDRF